uniref:LEM domain-containing protein n=1 Tax=Schistocephalus solidus TaxID=70667 RepID=A0A0X3NR98_SCHSO
MSSLSDEELRSSLRDHGVHVGPITETTRKVYERKLAKVTAQNVDKEEKKNRRQPRQSTTPLSSFKAEEPQTSLRAKNWPSQSPVNFGRSPSDEPFNNLSTNVVRREARSRSSVFYSDEPFFNPQTASPQQNPGHTPTRPVLRFDPLDSASVLQAQEHRLTNTPLHSRGFDEIDNNFDNHIVTRQSPTPVARSTGRFSFFRPSQTAPLKDAETSTSASLLFSPPNTVDQSQSYWPSFYLRHRSGSGVLSDDADSQWEYSCRRQTNGCLADGNADSVSSTVSRLVSSLGRHVPNLILLAGFTLFIVLLSCYFLLKDKHGNVGRIADLQKLSCPVGDLEAHPREHCLNPQELSVSLNLAHILVEILSRYAGEHRCGHSAASPRMDVNTARRLVAYHLSAPDSRYSLRPSDLDEGGWRNLLFLIRHVGRKHLDIAPFSADGDDPGAYKEIFELESLQPYIPGRCRLRLLFFSFLRLLATLLWVLFIFTVVGLCIFAVYRFRQSNKRQRDRRASRIRELVHQVTDILQQQLKNREVNQMEPPYVPVSTIRSTLRRSNSDVDDLWSELEQHVHLVEGCILVQEWRGVGETWQWQGGSGWQGSALLDQTQRLPFTVPPTECLKIRNMFTMDKLDFDAQKRLKREILKRVSGCGPIFHIGLDNQDNEGLVYLKCAGPEVAGNVYQAVHANYFDSHLLNVKFLRASKYYIRFPEAHDANIPLKVSDFE